MKAAIATLALLISGTRLFAEAECQVGYANAVTARKAAALFCAGIGKTPTMTGNLLVSVELTKTTWVMWVGLREEYGSVRDLLGNAEALTKLAVALEETEIELRLKTSGNLCLADPGPTGISMLQQSGTCAVRRGFSDGYHGSRWIRGRFVDSK